MYDDFEEFEHGDDGNSQVKRESSADAGQKIHAGHLRFLLARFYQFSFKVDLKYNSSGDLTGAFHPINYLALEKLL